MRGSPAGHLAIGGGHDHLARARGRRAANVAGTPRGEQHACELRGAARPKVIAVGPVGHEQHPVLAHGQAQRPVEAVRDHRADLALAKDLVDLPRDAGDEDPLAHEGYVVEPRTDVGQHLARAGAGIDPQHLTTVHLGRDDAALGVELDGVGHAEIPGDLLRRAALEADPPDLVGSHHREVEHAVRPHLEGVGHRHVFQQYPRRAAVQVQLHDAPARPALAGDQPPLVEGDGIGDGDVAVQHPGHAVRRAHADPPFRDFRSVEVAGGVKDKVVGRDDISAERTDRFHRAGLDVDGADLAAGHLRHVDASVRAGAQAVGAEKTAHRREPFQRPPLGQAGGPFGHIAPVLQRHTRHPPYRVVLGPAFSSRCALGLSSHRALGFNQHCC